MIIPKDKHIYIYNGEKYIVRYTSIFDNTVTIQTIPNNNEGSKFKNVKYWSFVRYAKHIGQLKIGKSY